MKKQKQTKKESHHQEWLLPPCDSLLEPEPKKDPSDSCWMKVFRKVYADLESTLPLGTILKVSINPRLTKTLARCLRSAKDPYGCFRIELSKQVLALDDPRILGDVIAHELIHTIDGCFNHSAKFKSMAKMASRFGYHVQTHFSYAYYNLENPNPKKPKEYKYIIECQTCHQQIRRVRKSKLIERPEHYRCAICGGTFKRIV